MKNILVLLLIFLLMTISLGANLRPRFPGPIVVPALPQAPCPKGRKDDDGVFIC